MTLSLKKLITMNILLISTVPFSAAYEPGDNITEALGRLRGYSALTSAAGNMNIDTYTSNLITWQMPHGGWCKGYESKYVQPWDGRAARSSWTNAGHELGTFDNSATIQEMRLLAERYKRTGDGTLKRKCRESFASGIGFILTSQYPSGGWPQVYPKRGNYSDHVTFNDDAMVRVMVLVKDIVDKKSPFDSDIVSSTDNSKLKTALDKALAYTLKAQIVDNDIPTVWCAQHDPSSYAPRSARSYELESKSGSESVSIVYFLINWPDQSHAIQTAAKGAFKWFRKTRVSDLVFNGRDGRFDRKDGATLWYRFYDLVGDKPFFCDRDGIKTYDFMTVGEERRTGYSWGGDYASSLLSLESDYLAAVPTVAVHPRASDPVTTVGTSILSHSGNTIVLSIGTAGTYGVALLDLSGAVISSRRVVSVNGHVTFRLPPGKTARGVCILRITRGDGSLVVTQPLLQF